MPRDSARRRDGEVFVQFSREFVGDTAEALLDVAAELANEGVPRVTLCLATPGGWFAKAETVYNMLRAMPFELTTHSVGQVDSAGVVAFLAGARRRACPGSSFLLHPGSFSTDANAQLDAQMMRLRIRALEDNDDREREVLTRRTRLSAARVRQLLAASTRLDAAAALDAGIVHEIKQLRIPAGSRVITAPRRT